ncbi:MAG TPA: metallophosphoesterase [bacterium]|nr:metallophosphoesterase [bacterium]
MRARSAFHAPQHGLLAALLFLSLAIPPASVFAQNISRVGVNDDVTRGPYLQVGRPDGIIVRWRTNRDLSSRVQYGLTPENLDQHVDNPNQTTEHEIVLNGLSSNTLYYYSVGSTSEVLLSGVDYKFRTSPPAGSVSPTRIWVLGDSGEDGQGPVNVRDAYYDYPGSQDTDVWLMLGDNAYNTGTSFEYQSLVFDRFKTFLRHCPLWSTRGNHEIIHPEANDDYFDFFTLPAAGQAGGLPSGSEAYYSFHYANIHFVCLDSQGSDRTPSGPMLSWLELDLDANTQPWIIAFWHHPPYSKGGHDSDASRDSGGRLSDMRENALPILEQGGVDLVLSGHSHSYERSMLIDGHYGTSDTFNPSMIVNDGDGDPSSDGAYHKPNTVGATHEGAVYTVAGSSGETSGGDLDHPIMVTSLNVLGSVVIDVNGPLLNAIFLDSHGDIRDHFQISKDTAAHGPQSVHSSDAGLSLASPAPNPFSSHTSLSYSLPAASHARLVVFDVTGRQVATLLDGRKEAGRHRAEWNGTDSAGNRTVAGTYFVQLEANGERRTQKVVLMGTTRN